MKALVISWFFPPSTSAEGLVTFKLLRNSAFSYEVLSAKSDQWSYKTESALSAENIRVRALDAPDFPSWVASCVREAEALLARDKYAFLMTRAMPPQSHEPGLILKRRHPELFWIASMADPIARNPYDIERYFRHPLPWFLKNLPRTAARALLYERRKRFETRVDCAADLLLYPSEDQCRYSLGSKADGLRNKVLLLPHSYDQKLIEAAGAPENAPRGGPVTIAHLGHLNAYRSAEGLLRAAALYKKSDPKAASRLRIRLVGNLPDDQRALVGELGVGDLVSCEPPVDYYESIRIMKAADFLLLVDADFSFMPHNIFLVSKLADYMGVGKPVIGLTTPEGPSAGLLKAAGCPTAAPDDAEGIRALLAKIGGGWKPEIRETVYGSLDAVRVAEKFDETVKKALGSPAD